MTDTNTTTTDAATEWIAQHPEIAHANATTTTITTDARVLLAQLEQTTPFVAAANGGRESLTGVHFAITRDALTLTAADGFRLVTVEAPCHRDVDGWSEIVHANDCKRAIVALKAAIKTVGKSGAVDATLARNGVVTLTLPGATLDLATISGTFPNYQQLIPAQDYNATGNHAAFNGALIGEILTVAGKHADDGIVRTMLQTPSQPARLDWRDSTLWTATAVIMPMFVTW